MDEIRRHRTPRRPKSPTPRSGTYSFDLLLPASYVHRQLRAQMERDGLRGSTAADVTGRVGARPAEGRRVIWQADEREAKYGKPIAYLDDRPGETPIIVVGGGEEHWQDLKEQADESRHYGYERQAAAERERPDMQAIWHERVERGLARQNGRVVFGPSQGPGKRGSTYAQPVQGPGKRGSTYAQPVQGASAR